MKETIIFKIHLIVRNFLTLCRVSFKSVDVTGHLLSNYNFQKVKTWLINTEWIRVKCLTQYRSQRVKLVQRKFSWLNIYRHWKDTEIVARLNNKTCLCHTVNLWYCLFSRTGVICVWAVLFIYITISFWKLTSTLTELYPSQC